MKNRRRARMHAVALCVLAGLMTSPASAAERFALIVVGASGGESYVETYDGWRETLVTALRDKLGFSADEVLVLAEREAPGIERSNRENVRRAVAALTGKIGRDDLLLVVLIGHGTFDGQSAKFNLVGPDLDAVEWAGLLRAVTGRLVVVNTTGASFPFLEELSARGRVVVTATDSAAQRYETVFPGFFAEALDGDASDFDKNGRVSVWEAFNYASLAVKQWYEQRGQLATERPLLDDNGDGVGKEAGAPGPDGALARTTYLDPEVDASIAADNPLVALHRRRAALEREIEELKANKPHMSAEDFEARFEKLVLELARISKEIRSKS